MLKVLVVLVHALVTLYGYVPVAETVVIGAEGVVIVPAAVFVLLSVTLVLSKTSPGDVIALPPASWIVSVPEQVLVVQVSLESCAFAATPLSVNALSVLTPDVMTYDALFSAKTVVPLSISTANVYECGTASDVLQLIVQLGLAHAPAPELVAPPLMNTAACVVALEMYAGLRALALDVFGNTIVTVPVTACSEVLGIRGGLCERPPEHEPIPAASARAHARERIAIVS
jgi:hypothetical protein